MKGWTDSLLSLRKCSGDLMEASKMNKGCDQLEAERMFALVLKTKTSEYQSDEPLRSPLENLEKRFFFIQRMMRMWKFKLQDEFEVNSADAEGQGRTCTWGWKESRAMVQYLTDESWEETQAEHKHWQRQVGCNGTELHWCYINWHERRPLVAYQKFYVTQSHSGLQTWTIVHQATRIKEKRLVTKIRHSTGVHQWNGFGSIKGLHMVETFANQK